MIFWPDFSPGSRPSDLDGRLRTPAQPLETGRASAQLRFTGGALGLWTEEPRALAQKSEGRGYFAVLE